MFEVNNLVWYHIIIKTKCGKHLVNTIGLDGIFPSKSFRNKNPPSAVNFRVGFYFLLMLLMYDKRARINIPKRNIIVIASFTSMASPPFEGKPCPPKIQLYFHFTFIFFSAQAFLFACIFVFFIVISNYVYDFIRSASLSYNIPVFTNPHRLKGRSPGRDALSRCRCVH